MAICFVCVKNSFICILQTYFSKCCIWRMLSTHILNYDSLTNCFFIDMFFSWHNAFKIISFKCWEHPLWKEVAFQYNDSASFIPGRIMSLHWMWWKWQFNIIKLIDFIYIIGRINYNIFQDTKKFHNILYCFMFFFSNCKPDELWIPFTLKAESPALWFLVCTTFNVKWYKLLWINKAWYDSSF